MVVLAIGDAVKIVPVVATGGGRGLVGLNSACISSGPEMSKLSDRSCGRGLFLYEDVGLDVGREKLTGLDGGDDFSCRGDELQPTKVVVSDVAACGDELKIGDRGSGRKESSKSVDSGRLPGIVSKPARVTGGDD
jgi:hypothetical protein